MLGSLFAIGLHKTWMDTHWQFHADWNWLHIPAYSLLYASDPLHSEVSPQNSHLPVLLPLPLPSELTLEENSIHVLLPLRTYSKFPVLNLYCDTSSYPHRQSLYFLSNLCTETYTSSSPHIYDLWTNLCTKICSITMLWEMRTCVVHQFCRINNAPVMKDLFFGVMSVSNNQWS